MSVIFSCLSSRHPSCIYCFYGLVLLLHCTSATTTKELQTSFSARNSSSNVSPLSLNLPLQQNITGFQKNNGMDNTTLTQRAPLTSLKPQSLATPDDSIDEDAPEKLILFHCFMFSLTGVSARYLYSLKRRKHQARYHQLRSIIST